MSSVPRISSAIPSQGPHFGSVLAHQPLLAARFGELYGTFWASDRVSAQVKELCRMRNARITQCGFCRQVRFDKALSAGLGEETIEDVTDDYARSDKLSAAEKAALRFTDALIFDPDLLDGEARQALHRHYTPNQIEELGIGVSLFLALAKVLITLGLEPEQMERTVLPTPSAASTSGEGLKARFDTFLATPRDAGLVNRELLDLTRDRIVAIHRGERLEAPADAPLAFAAKIPFEHHAITDAEAAAARDALGDAGLVAFTVAAALMDAEWRLRAVTQQEAALA